MSKILLPHNVFDAAVRRIEWLLDEFEHLTVNYSGGKDSTVILELAVIAAEKKGRLPVEVLIVDQEGEWTSTVEMFQAVNARPELDVKWLQCPIQIFNATSGDDPWLWCWREGDEWLRPKEPGTVHDNVFGTTRFTDIMGASQAYFHPDQSVAQINGVRCEESPARRMGLTTYPNYKHVTWGAITDKALRHYRFSPIYDWRYIDVWKAIHDNGWLYNRLYDLMYQHGISPREMRVSSVHHETALRSLTYLHEFDADLWNKLTARLHGINTAKHLDVAMRKPPKVLPRAFSDWRDYRDYLLENLIVDPDIRAIFRRQFDMEDRRFLPEIHDELWKTHVSEILVGDYHGTKMSTFTAANGRYLIGRGRGREREEAKKARAAEAAGG